MRFVTAAPPFLLVPGALSASPVKPFEGEAPVAYLVGRPGTYELAIKYSDPVKAPIKRGPQIAERIARFPDGHEQRIPLVASGNVAKAGYMGRALNGLKSRMGWS